MFLAKLSPGGEAEWTRRVGLPTNNMGRMVVESDDGGLVVLMTAQDAFSPHKKNIEVIKFSPSGEVVSAVEVRAPFGDDSPKKAIADGSGVLIAGYTTSEGDQNKSVILIKLDSEGNKEWIKIIGGLFNTNSQAIIKLKPSGYALCGYASYVSSG